MLLILRLTTGRWRFAWPVQVLWSSSWVGHRTIQQLRIFRCWWYMGWISTHFASPAFWMDRLWGAVWSPRWFPGNCADKDRVTTTAFFEWLWRWHVGCHKYPIETINMISRYSRWQYNEVCGADVACKRKVLYWDITPTTRRPSRANIRAEMWDYIT